MHTHDDIYLGMETERVLSTRSPSMKFSEFRLYMLPRPSSQRLQHVRVFFSPKRTAVSRCLNILLDRGRNGTVSLSAHSLPPGQKRKKKVKECSIAYDGRSWSSRRSNGSCYLQRGITRNDFIFRILQPSVQACQTMFKKEFVLSMHRAKSLISDGMQEWIDNLL